MHRPEHLLKPRGERKKKPPRTKKKPEARAISSSSEDDSRLEADEVEQENVSSITLPKIKFKLKLIAKPAPPAPKIEPIPSRRRPTLRTPLDHAREDLIRQNESSLAEIIDQYDSRLRELYYLETYRNMEAYDSQKIKEDHSIELQTVSQSSI